MNQATVQQITVEPFYGKDLREGIEAWNDELSQIKAERGSIASDAKELKQRAAVGLVDADEITRTVGDLRRRAVALDVQEFRLLARKGDFQQAVTDARKVEREKAVTAAKKRQAEIEKGLDKLKTDSMHRPAMVNGDSQYKAHQARANALGQFHRLVDATDEARLAVLSGRLGAMVPTFD